MQNQVFIPKSKYPNHTKAQIAKMLKNPRYSGKTIYVNNNVMRGPGFYCDL